MGEAKQHSTAPGARAGGVRDKPEPRRDVVRDDVTCAACGYHLRGVPVGAPCPECGTFVAGGTRAQRDRTVEGTILEAPMRYLRRLRLVTMLLAISAGGLLLVPFSFGAGAPALLPVAILSALSWIACVWLLTLPRQFEDGQHRPDVAREWAGSRWLSRLTQPAWILGIGALAVSRWAPGLVWVGLVLLVLGVLGMSAVAIHVGRLAEWGSHHSLSLGVRVSGCVMAAALGLGVLGGTMAQVSAARNANSVGFFGGLGGLIAAPAYFFMVLAGMAFFLGLVRFSNAISWSVKNKQRALDREARFREKVARARAEQSAKGPEPVVPSRFLETPLPAASTPASDPRRRMIEDSTLCGSCGGELMGCHPGDPCPECRAPIPVV